VRDEHDARGQAAEEPLQPLEAGEVEVVRRLVEQEDVEAREQDRSERGTRRLAARERGDVPGGSTFETDLGQDGAGAGVEALAPSARKRSSASEYNAARPGSSPSRAASPSISDSAAPTPVRRAR
jgi:hypothetical protein